VSTYAEFRSAWEEWAQAALSGIQVGWTNDPGDMFMKLPVAVEMDGPTTITNTGLADYIEYDPEGLPEGHVAAVLHSHRNAIMILRATSRDNIGSPAELTLERARAGLRRPDLREILRGADIAVQSVGPTVRYSSMVNGRVESSAAIEIRIGWRITDESGSSEAFGTLESAELEPVVDGVERPPFTVDGSQ
jgi:hypothetical protein